MMESYSGLTLFLDFAIIAVFLWGIWLFGSPRTAKAGNLVAAFALASAAVLIMFRSGTQHPYILVCCLLAGSGMGYLVALKINMIQIPAMVAFQNGAGGMAAFFLSFAELMRRAGQLDSVNEISGLLGLVIGALTFSGSMVAAGKLSQKLRQTPVILKSHSLLTLASLLVAFGLVIAAMLVPLAAQAPLYILIVLVAGGFGILFSIRVGGADMPVLISFLNATSAVAAALCGMIIGNKLLIACGATVAASGTILTHVMCRAMNRTLFTVLFPGQAEHTKMAEQTKEEETPEQEPVREPAEDKLPAKQEGAKQLLNGYEKAITHVMNAQKVIIVPGYGMAVAQAQFAVLDLSKKLVEMGKQVKFAIHPVAGRMPGHMNVLLAEAGIDYELLFEMDSINSEFKETDVTLVVGACDVVNPAAIETRDTPISGMPVLLAHESKAVICCNLDQNPGYSGVQNPLYAHKNTIMLTGDARQSVENLTGHLEVTDMDALDTDPQEGASSPLAAAVEILASANRVIFVPGYGMAQAQAQFKVAQLASMLQQKGAEVKFAIHPVAGRMPGHMNVLLAEAEVEYDLLIEMDEINPQFAGADVAVVIGACDVVNPVAREKEGTPISGMPILTVQEAGRVVVCNFDTKPGYSGVENSLYTDPNTLMLQGDAAQTAHDLINGLKEAV